MKTTKASVSNDEIGTIVANVGSLLDQIKQLLTGEQEQPEGEENEMDENAVLESIMTKREKGEALSDDDRKLLLQLADMPPSGDEDEDDEEKGKKRKSDADADAEERVEGDQPPEGEEAVSDVSKGVKQLVETLTLALTKSADPPKKAADPIAVLAKAIDKLVERLDEQEQINSAMLEGMGLGDSITKAYEDELAKKATARHGTQLGGEGLAVVKALTAQLEKMNGGVRPASVANAPEGDKKPEGLGNVLKAMFGEPNPDPVLAQRPNGRV